jgi:hypothetical protein
MTGARAMFSRAPTPLHRSRREPLRFLVIDRWASSEAYVDFLEGHRAEYERRNRATRRLYRQESVIGRFEPVIPPAGLTVERHPGTYAVCRLDRDAPVPDWAEDTELCSITRTADEPSVVCPDGAVSEDVVAEGGWRCLRVAGPFDFRPNRHRRRLEDASGRWRHTSDDQRDLRHRLHAHPSGAADRAIAALTSPGHRVVD